MRMRTLIISLLVVATLPSTLLAQEKAKANKINWVHVNDLPDAIKNDPKPVLMDVYTSWCGPCKMMMAKTFTEKKLVAYVNQNFHAVKFNAEGNDTISFKGTDYTNPTYDPAKARTRNGTHQFAGIAAVNGRLAYPTLVYLDENLNMLTPIQGYLKPEQLDPILTYFGEGHYKTEKDYQKWLSGFKSKLYPSTAPAKPVTTPPAGG